MKIADEYIRPIDDETDLHRKSECDMLIMQPLLNLGLWKHATKKEIEAWKEKDILKE